MADSDWAAWGGSTGPHNENPHAEVWRNGSSAPTPAASGDDAWKSWGGGTHAQSDNPYVDVWKSKSGGAVVDTEL
jgi:hypothetical protein